MASPSKIEWTGHSWNVSTGCNKTSPGCKHCYAESMAIRLQAMGASGYEQGFKLSMHPERLDQPTRRKKSTTYFVNSMSDLFHEDIEYDFLDEVLAIIKKTPQHTYQILTKRADRMANYFSSRECPQNAWLGVSVEDRAHGVPRIDFLRGINTHVRFLSIEPLLEDLGSLNLSDIHWVIVGGESGHKARPMQESWVTAIKSQADKVQAAFFFKQWGTWGADGIKRSKKTNGRMLRGRIYDAFPFRQDRRFI